MLGFEFHARKYREYTHTHKKIGKSFLPTLFQSNRPSLSFFIFDICSGMLQYLECSNANIELFLLVDLRLQLHIYTVNCKLKELCKYLRSECHKKVANKMCVHLNILERTFDSLV